MSKYKIILIGLGNQMIKDHLPAILKRDDLILSGIVDSNELLCKKYAEDLKVPWFNNVSEAVVKISPDAAVVSVPHNQYYPILEVLAKNRVATLKEKPFGINLEESLAILKLYQENKTYFQICVQRRFSNLYDTMKDKIKEIGDVHSLYAEYMLSLKTLDQSVLGWRADKSISGGGASLDLGYHTIDLITNLFGVPDKLYAQLSFNSLPGNYTIDDSSKVMMTFHNKINANMMITKIYVKKMERIRIFGTKGYVNLDNRTVNLMDRDGNILESHSFNTKEKEVDSQLDYFIANMKNPQMTEPRNNLMLNDQLINMKIIDSIYKSHYSEEVIKF